MTRACIAAIHEATGKVFTDAEADDVVNRLTAKALRARKQAPGISDRQAVAQAAGELTREQLMAAMIARRSALADEITRQKTARAYDAMPARMSPADKLNALNTGSERQGFGTSASVDARGRARQMSLWGQVQIGLDKMPGLADRMSNWMGIGERGFDRLIAREMARLSGGEGIEPTGDAGALHAAQVLVAALEKARTMQNDLGAWIARQSGYIARQAHDAQKVAGGFWRENGEVLRRVQASGGKLDDLELSRIRQTAENRAFGQWRDYIMPRLDPKTFDGLELEDVHFTRWEDEAQETRQMGRQAALREAQGLAAKGVLRDPTDLKELMLHRVWRDIVTGRGAELSGADDASDFRPPSSLAASVSKARVLHFKDPDAWADYNERYGRSSLYATVMHQLERAGRNSALMETWGTNPEAGFNAMKAHLLKTADAAGETVDARGLNHYMVQAHFDTVNGAADTPANPRAAQVMRTIRGWEALTKLGSIVLSKTGDAVLSANAMKRAGGTWLDGYKGWFDGITKLGSADAKAAADSFDVGARSFAGHMGSQYLSSDGAPGWTSWATRLMYKLNAFEYMNDGVQNGAAQTFSRILGQQAGLTHDALSQGTRETFERFGITPKDWDAARQGLTPASDGKTYFTLDKVTDPATALKFQTMFHNVIEDTTGESRGREKAAMTRGTKAGTWEGEAMRAFFQFKGFVNTIVGRHLVPAASGFACVSPVALVAHLILGLTLTGWLSMNAKLIVSGRDPRGVAGSDLGQTGKIWSAALAQGGGLGLYGDFLFGEQNRNGAAFSIAQLAGPALGDFEQVATVVQQAIAGGQFSETTGRSPLPGELVRLAGHNIPLVNLWYTRLALDYMVLWDLQEHVSPGYLQRYEQRVRSQEGGDFWAQPTAVW